MKENEAITIIQELLEINSMLKVQLHTNKIDVSLHTKIREEVIGKYIQKLICIDNESNSKETEHSRATVSPIGYIDLQVD